MVSQQMTSFTTGFCRRRKLMEGVLATSLAAVSFMMTDLSELVSGDLKDPAN